MTNKFIQLGDIKIDALAYGVAANAILGIKESGKSYTATAIAEQLFDLGIPFVAFDPVGIWRFMRTPGRGHGYPIVIAGGASADWPLTVATAPEILRAAMHDGISLVIDLFDIKLSKADWRRIVMACVNVLLFENAPHGMRHFFLEEAAEFVPQRVEDGQVYAAVEKLVRMGGNSRVGCTLINPRSQEVNKAVLELCENLFLHRQRGKNAIENLDKWLNIAEVGEREAIITSLPSLPTGEECWAWIGGDRPRPPHLIKVQAKNSFHPNRRMIRGQIIARRKRVDVGDFVSKMRSSLSTIEEQAKANDPTAIRAELAKVKAENAKLEQRLAQATAKAAAKPAPDALAAAEKHGYERAQKRRDATATRAAQAQIVTTLDAISSALVPLADAHRAAQAAINTALREARQVRPTVAVEPYAPPPLAPMPAPARPLPTPMPVDLKVNGGGKPADGITGPQQRILDAIRWWNVIGIQPTMPQVSFIARYSHRTGTWNTYMGGLRSAGLIEPRGDPVLTAAGAAAAREPETLPDGWQLRAQVLAMLRGPHRKILGPILEAYPNGLTKEEAGERAGYSPRTGTWNTYVSALRSRELIERSGELKAQSWLFP